MSEINDNNNKNSQWNPFTILNLPQQYELSPASVKQAALKLLAVNHPDRFTSTMDRENAESVSAQINKARKTLLNDESRAAILLKLSGGPDKDQDKTLPAGFLMEIMELREEMETVLSSDNPGNIEKYKTWANRRRNHYKLEIQKLFNKIMEKETRGKEEKEEDQILKTIRIELNAWRYIERMIEQLQD